MISKLCLTTITLCFLLVAGVIVGCTRGSTEQYSADGETDEQTPINFIIIFADDLGYGDLSSYGHPLINTTNLDQMAAEGLRLTSFYAAASVCTPSRAALLTGRYPIRNAPHNFGPESQNGLPLEEITIADLLKEQGYATMAVGKWHLGHQPQYLPTNRGFDDFYGLPYSNDMILPWCPWLTEADRLFLYEGDQPTQEIGFNQKELTVNYTRESIEFIQQNKHQPFFLYLAHSMPHLPISTADEFVGKSKAGLYGDVIETIDWSVGEILKTLKEADIDEQTLVIFTSDNGPWQDLPNRMLQHGVEPWHSGSAGLLRGSKATTYEGGFRVPAILRWPQTIEEGRVEHDVVTTMDLFVTLANLAGAPVPSDRAIDGRDVRDLLNNQSQISERTFYYLKEKKLQAVRVGDWKLRATADQGFELYNLKQDPSERLNLAPDHQDKVEDLYGQLMEFAVQTEAQVDTIQN